MTNEEHVEEIYYEAHANGFIDSLRDKVNHIIKTVEKISHADAVFMAYDKIIKGGD
jgi:hypothetical protein